MGGFIYVDCTTQWLGPQVRKRDCPGSNLRSVPYLLDDYEQGTKHLDASVSSRVKWSL